MGHKYWEGKHFGEFYFETKNLEKFPFIFSKISDDLFVLVIDNFLTKFTPFIQNVLRFLCILKSSLLFSQKFLTTFFLVIDNLNKKIKKFSSDYWGGQKSGFAPILIIGGSCPGCPPESTPMIVANTKPLNKLGYQLSVCRNALREANTQKHKNTHINDSILAVHPQCKTYQNQSRK